MIAYLKRTLKDRKIRKIKDFEKGCWVNIVNPSEEEVELLSERFHLDKINLISGLDENEVPRVEFDGDIFYVILKTICSEDRRCLHTLLVIEAGDFILTLSKHELSFIERIIEGKTEFITTQKLKCLIKIFSMVTRDFEKATLDIVRSVNSKRESIAELTEKDLNSLLQQESALNRFVSAYYYTNLLYERIIKHTKFFEEDKEILEDLIIEAKQGFDLSKSALKTISNIRNHQVILLSNKLNKVITLLTIFTIFITVPAAISGIYGMNVLLPLGASPYVFYYITLFIIFIWLTFVLYLKKIKMF